MTYRPIVRWSEHRYKSGSPVDEGTDLRDRVPEAAQVGCKNIIVTLRTRPGARNTLPCGRKVNLTMSSPAPVFDHEAYHDFGVAAWSRAEEVE